MTAWRYLVEPEPRALGAWTRGAAGRPRAASQAGQHRAKAYVQREHTPQAARRKLEAFYTDDGIARPAAAGVRTLWRSATLRSAAVLGISGVGFAVANLVLARVLPTEEYAVFTLVVALVNVGYPMAAAGVDGMVNRRRLEAGPRLLRRLMQASIPVGARVRGHRPCRIRDLAAGFPDDPVVRRRGQRGAGGRCPVPERAAIRDFPRPEPESESHPAARRRLGPRRGLTPRRDAPGGLDRSASSSPRRWAGRCSSGSGTPSPHHSVDFPWSEALAIAGLSAAGLLLIQIERLMLPHLLPLEELATYGVLAAIAGSLFRVLQMGVGYSLLPRLRAAPGVIERRRLLVQGVPSRRRRGGHGLPAIWVATPRIEDWFLGGKYHLPGALVLAAVVTGFAKVLNGFAQSAVSALAEPRELHLVSVLGWVSVGVAIAGRGGGRAVGPAGRHLWRGHSAG